MSPGTAVRRRADDRGVTIVEAAFALPILLMFMFGLVDLGMWVFNSNQATNAARDGARLGIIDFEGAEVRGGSTHDAIVEAAEARLNRDVTPEQVDVQCLRDGLPLLSCDDAHVDSDHIEVEVTWHWDLVTPIAQVVGLNRGAATGKATMVLVGRPLSPPPAQTVDGPDTPTSTTCVATIDEWPTSVVRKNNSNQLQHAVEVAFSTSGTCTQLRVELESPSGDRVPQVVCGCDTNPKTEGSYEYAYRGSDNIWTPSSDGALGFVRIYDGTVVVGFQTFTVT